MNISTLSADLQPLIYIYVFLSADRRDLGSGDEDGYGYDEDEGYDMEGDAYYSHDEEEEENQGNGDRQNFAAAQGRHGDGPRRQPAATHAAPQASQGQPFRLRDGAVDEDSRLGRQWRQDAKRFIK